MAQAKKKTNVPLWRKFASAVEEMSHAFYEREELSTIMVAATLARFNTFILGGAGLAKSEMIRHLGSMFTDATVFDRQCHPTQALADVIGPLKISEIKRGNDVYERKLVRYLAQADIGFLDEIGRSSGPVRDSIMGIMNERIYWNGDTLVECPLQCLFTGSNHLLTDSRDEAFMDRFTFVYHVEGRLKAESNFRKLLQRKKLQAPLTEISLKELGIAQAEVQVIADSMSEETEDALVALERALYTDGIEASPRTWGKVRTVLAAFAYIQGDAEIMPHHLEWLADMLWKRPEERHVILAQIGKVANPVLSDAVKVLDRLKATIDRLPEDHNERGFIDQMAEANGAASNAVDALEGMVEKCPTPRIKALHKEAATLKSGLIDRARSWRLA